MNTVIFGPGAIGGYLGAHLLAGDTPVTFLARDRRAADLRKNGLHTSDGVAIAGETLDVATDVDVLSQADRVILTVKSTALDDALPLLAKLTRSGATIFCLLNGVSAARRIANAVSGATVVPGMVPFNVMPRADGTLHRSSTGMIALPDCGPARDLATLLSGTPCAIDLAPDIAAVQWGKLLLNLNNPVNALSGLPLKAQLRDRGFRAVYAAALEEALAVYAASGTTYEDTAALPARKIVKVLRWPNIAFNLLALPRQRLDEESQTSMAQDLAAGRKTEIDTLNGEIVALAKDHGLSAPVNAGLCRLVHAAEQGDARRWDSAALARELGLG